MNGGNADHESQEFFPDPSRVGADDRDIDDCGKESGTLSYDPHAFAPVSGDECEQRSIEFETVTYEIKAESHLPGDVHLEMLGQAGDASSQ